MSRMRSIVDARLHVASKLYETGDLQAAAEAHFFVGNLLMDEHLWTDSTEVYQEWSA